VVGRRFRLWSSSSPPLAVTNILAAAAVRPQASRHENEKMKMKKLKSHEN
jgi:hypothetical protein